MKGWPRAGPCDAKTGIAASHWYMLTMSISGDENIRLAPAVIHLARTLILIPSKWDIACVLSNCESWAQGAIQRCSTISDQSDQQYSLGQWHCRTHFRQWAPELKVG